jgi:hypothetical protein
MPNSSDALFNTRFQGYKSLQDMIRAQQGQMQQPAMQPGQAPKQVYAGFGDSFSLPVGPTASPTDARPEGDCVELFRIAGKVGEVDAEVVPVYLPLGRGSSLDEYSAIQITLPLYRTREDAEQDLQRMCRKSLYETVVGAIERLVDLTFRRGIGGKPEQALHSALLDYKAEVKK